MTDWQPARYYLELVMLRLLTNIKMAKQEMVNFLKDLPSAIGQDEYDHAEALCNMLCVDRQPLTEPEDMLEMDWAGVKERLKAPMFGFLQS